MIKDRGHHREDGSYTVGTLTMETAVAPRSGIPLIIVALVARDNCYCPTCRVWYNCASDAHAGH